MTEGLKFNDLSVNTKNLFFIIYLSIFSPFEIVGEMFNDVDNCKCSSNRYRSNRHKPYYTAPLHTPSSYATKELIVTCRLNANKPF